MDFVGEYENRRADLAHVGKQIGFPEFGQSATLNRNPEYDYREYYDDELCEIVAEACRWEIERFNYLF